MICKWCGSAVKRGDNKCGRCGKDTAPLSACGGFYDLVPAAVPVAPVPVQKKEEEKNQLAMILAVACAVLAVLVIILLISNGSLKSEIADLEDELSDDRGGSSGETVMIDPSGEPTDPEDTEAVEQPSDPAGESGETVEVPTTMPQEEEKKPSLSSENVTIKLKIEETDDGYRLVDDSEDDKVRVEARGKNVTVSLPGENPGECLSLRFAEKDGRPVVEYDLDEAVFGDSEEGFRLVSVTAEDEDKTSLLSKIESNRPDKQPGEHSGNRLPLDWEMIYERAKDERLEDTTLICEFERKSVDGGKLTIVISGIQIEKVK